MQPYSRNSFLDVVTGKTPIWGPSPDWTNEKLSWDELDDRPRIMKPNPGWRVLRGGTARGPLMVGNLTILLALAGTPYFPDMTGKILCIEDDRESSLPYWDLHLNQLREMGVLDRIAGLLIGRAEGLTSDLEDAGGDSTGAGGTDGDAPEARRYGLKELLAEQLGRYAFPIAWDVDFGHTDPMLTLPLGVEAEVDTDRQTVRLTEAAVSP